MKKLIPFIILFSFFSKASLVDWQSEEGLKLLSESKYNIDFPALSNQFQNQFDKISCGPTTGAIVLNTLRLGIQKTLPKINFPQKYKRYLPKALDPHVERYSPESFMKPKKLIKKKITQKTKTLKQLYGQKKDLGLQLRQLHEIFLAHGVDSKIRVVSEDLPDKTIKQELMKNLQTKADYVVINYKRTLLGQKGGGHISPLGAYHEKTDSFLIMDVNSTRYNWVWVPTKKLIEAMRSFDMKENRGYLLLKE